MAIAGTYASTPSGEDVSVQFGDVLLQVLTDPLFIAIGLLYLLQTLHKVMFRIDDIDTM